MWDGEDGRRTGDIRLSNLFRAFPHYRGSGPTGPHSEQASGGAWGASRAYSTARKDARQHC